MAVSSCARLPQVPKASSSRRLRAEIHTVFYKICHVTEKSILFLVARLFHLPRETIVIDVYGVLNGRLGECAGAFDAERAVARPSTFQFLHEQTKREYWT